MTDAPSPAAEAVAENLLTHAQWMSDVASTLEVLARIVRIDSSLTPLLDQICAELARLHVAADPAD
jgi:hypothetical protein